MRSLQLGCGRGGIFPPSSFSAIILATGLLRLKRSGLSFSCLVTIAFASPLLLCNWVQKEDDKLWIEMEYIQPFRFHHLRAHLCNQKRLVRVCEKVNSPGAFPRFAVCIRNIIDQL